MIIQDSSKCLKCLVTVCIISLVCGSDLDNVKLKNDSVHDINFEDVKIEDVKGEDMQAIGVLEVEGESVEGAKLKDATIKDSKFEEERTDKKISSSNGGKNTIEAYGILPNEEGMQQTKTVTPQEFETQPSLEKVELQALKGKTGTDKAS